MIIYDAYRNLPGMYACSQCRGWEEEAYIFACTLTVTQYQLPQCENVLVDFGHLQNTVVCVCVCVCACVCVCVCERERERENPVCVCGGGFLCG